MALARIKRWWMAPAFGRAAADVPQMLLVELPRGAAAAPPAYAVLLPLIDYDGTGFRCTLFGDERGRRRDAPPASSADGAAAAAGAGAGALRARVESGDPAVTARRVPRALFETARAARVSQTGRGTCVEPGYAGGSPADCAAPPCAAPCATHARPGLMSQNFGV